MATTGSGTSTPVVPISGAPTLAALILRWRGKLGDNVGDEDTYLWPSEELTDNANQTLIEMSEAAPLFKDMTTSATCTLAVAIGTAALTLSDRVIKVLRAKLASDTSPLQVTTVAEMDAGCSGWEDAENGDVTRLILDTQTGTIRLYPPSAAVDTLTLTVLRVPAMDLTFAANSADAVSLPARYFECLEYGVLARAYLKGDVDTVNPLKAAEYRKLYLGALERVKVAVLQLHAVRQTVVPLEGNL